MFKHGISGAHWHIVIEELTWDLWVAAGNANKIKRAKARQAKAEKSMMRRKEKLAQSAAVANSAARVQPTSAEPCDEETEGDDDNELDVSDANGRHEGNASEPADSSMTQPDDLAGTAPVDLPEAGVCWMPLDDTSASNHAAVQTVWA